MACSAGHTPLHELACPALAATDALAALQRRSWIAAHLGVPTHVLSGRLHLQAQHREKSARCRAKRAAGLRAPAFHVSPVADAPGPASPHDAATSPGPQAVEPTIAKANSITSDDGISFERTAGKLAGAAQDTCTSGPPSPASPPLQHPPLRPSSPAEQPQPLSQVSSQKQQQQQHDDDYQQRQHPRPDTGADAGSGGEDPVGGAFSGSPGGPSEAEWEALLDVAVKYYKHECVYNSTPEGSVEEQRACRAMAALRGPLAASVDQIDIMRLVEQLAAASPAATVAAAGADGGGRDGGTQAAEEAAEAKRRQQRTLFGPLMSLFVELQLPPHDPNNIRHHHHHQRQQQEQLELLVARTVLLIAVHGKLGRPVPTSPQLPDLDHKEGRDSGISVGGKKKQKHQKQQQQQHQQQQQQQRRQEVKKETLEGSAGGGAVGGAAVDVTQEQQEEEAQAGRGCKEEEEEAQARQLVGRLEPAVVLVDGLLRHAGFEGPPLLYPELQILALLVSELQAQSLTSSTSLVRGITASLSELTSLQCLVRVARSLSSIILNCFLTPNTTRQILALPILISLHLHPLRIALHEAGGGGGGSGGGASLREMYETALQGERKRLEQSILKPDTAARKAGGGGGLVGGRVLVASLQRLLFMYELCRKMPQVMFGGSSGCGGGGSGDAAAAAYGKAVGREAAAAGGVVVLRLAGNGSREPHEALARVLLSALAAGAVEVEEVKKEGTGAAAVEEEGQPDGGRGGRAAGPGSAKRRSASLVAVGADAMHLALRCTAAMSAILTGVAAAGGGRGDRKGVGGGPLLVSVLRSPQLSAQYAGVSAEIAGEPDGGVVALSFTVGGPEVASWMRAALLQAPRLEGPICSDLAELRGDLVRHLDERHAVVVHCSSSSVLAAVLCILGKLHVESIRQGTGLVVVSVPLGDPHANRRAAAAATTAPEQQRAEGDTATAAATGVEDNQFDKITNRPYPETDRRMLRHATACVLHAIGLVPSMVMGVAASTTSTAIKATTESEAAGDPRGRLRPDWRLRQRVALNAATCHLTGLSAWPGVLCSGGDGVLESSGGGDVTGDRFFLDCLALNLIVAKCHVGCPAALLPLRPPPPSPPLPPPPPTMTSPKRARNKGSSGFRFKFW